MLFSIAQMYVVAQFFKVLGFVLHAVPMGIWFAGLPLAVLCIFLNGKNSNRFARRIFTQLPIMLAIGINFGIVPLLFTQTIFYKPFYTATILMAWHWFAVIPILIVGYYAVYLAAFSVATPNSQKQNAKKNNKENKRNKNSTPINNRTIIFGIIASLCLIAIGTLIVNGQTLMVRSDLWLPIMERTGVYGATTGLANNMSDPSVWVRLSTVFAIGLVTTAVWSIVDSYFLLRKSDEAEDQANDAEYKNWTLSFAFIVTIIGAFVLAGVGCLTACFKITGFVSTGISEMSATEMSIFIASAVSLVIVGVLIGVMKLCVGLRGKILVVLVAIAQTAVLAGFATIRQIGQNTRLQQYVESAQSLSLAWEAFIPFLIIFVIGVVVIGWMLRQLIVSRVDENN
ncbi:MAG: hypothetical protein LBJ00_13515 [Planctomycetaceae bacterium]|jgi:hypothetical protein|nr:hypothetical protein [Planctomycetaceae bacterium]